MAEVKSLEKPDIPANPPDREQPEFTLEQLKNGDEPAWERAFPIFYNLIMNVLAPFLGGIISREDIEEIAREAILKIIQKKVIDKFVKQGRSVEWLKRSASLTAKNLLLDLLDKRKAIKRGQGKTESLNKLAEESGFELPSTSFIEDLNRRENAILIKEKLKLLPLNHRSVIEPYFFDGLTEEEIAHKLNLPLGTVAGWKSRGLKQLRQILKMNVSNDDIIPL